MLRGPNVSPLHADRPPDARPLCVQKLWAYLDDCDSCSNEPLLGVLMRAGRGVLSATARELQRKSSWLAAEQAKEYQRMRALRVFAGLSQGKARSCDVRGTPLTQRVSASILGEVSGPRFDSRWQIRTTR